MDEKWITTIKLKETIVENIDKFVNNKNFNYRTRTAFVVEAIRDKVEIDTILQQLTPIGRIYFNDMIKQGRWKIFETAKNFKE